MRDAKFELLNLCKSLVFCFITQVTLPIDAAKRASSDGDECRNSAELLDLSFAQTKLNDTFEVVSNWMDSNRLKNVIYLKEELKVSYSISFTILVSMSNMWFDASCGRMSFIVTICL